jgi:hypothetical protein
MIIEAIDLNRTRQHRGIQGFFRRNEGHQKEYLSGCVGEGR